MKNNNELKCLSSYALDRVYKEECTQAAFKLWWSLHRMVLQVSKTMNQLLSKNGLDYQKLQLKMKKHHIIGWKATGSIRF